MFWEAEGEILQFVSDRLSPKCQENIFVEIGDQYLCKEETHICAKKEKIADARATQPSSAAGRIRGTKRKSAPRLKCSGFRPHKASVGKWVGGASFFLRIDP